MIIPSIVDGIQTVIKHYFVQTIKFCLLSLFQRMTGLLFSFNFLLQFKPFKKVSSANPIFPFALSAKFRHIFSPFSFQCLTDTSYQLIWLITVLSVLHKSIILLLVVLFILLTPVLRTKVNVFCTSASVLYREFYYTDSLKLLQKIVYYGVYRILRLTLLNPFPFKNFFHTGYAVF